MNSLYNYIKAYINNQPIENYGDDTTSNSIMGLTIGVFLFILLISLIIEIWAIVVLIKYWKNLPSWAQVLGIIGVLPFLPGGPIITLIVVYVAKTVNSKQ